MVCLYPAEENNEEISILCVTYVSGERTGTPVHSFITLYRCQYFGVWGVSIVHALAATLACASTVCIVILPKFPQSAKVNFVKQGQLAPWEKKGMEFCSPVKVTVLQYHSLSWISKIDTSNTTVQFLVNTEVYFNWKKIRKPKCKDFNIL